MNKYSVSLVDGYNGPNPLVLDWDYELIGEVFRVEFDEYFAQEQERVGKVRAKEMFRSEYIKRFMISKRINLVDDPSNGNLKSVFIIKPGEKKIIDERAKNTLAARFEYKVRTDSEGKSSSPEGFMKFTLIEGQEKGAQGVSKTLQVEGNDIQYFEEEVQPEEPKEEVVAEEFICEVCGKSFDGKRGLHAHSLSHKK